MSEEVGTSLITIDANRPVALMSIRNMDYDAIEKKLDDEAVSFSMFPGDPLTFDGKRGQWRWGHGKKGIPFAYDQVSFVLNIPNAVEGWQKFVDNKPVNGPMVYICGPDRLPDRDTLGDTNEALWPTDSFGKKQDPWKRYVVCPVRIDGDQKVNHLSISTFWGVIYFKDLVKKFAQEGRRNIGKLPVVNLGRDVKERKDAKGETFDVPTFDIVAWDDPVAADIPDGAEQAAAQVAIPDANVTTTQRTSTKDTVTKLVEEAQAKAAAAPNVEPTPPAPPSGRRTGGTVQPAQAASQTARPAGLFAGSGRRQPVRA